MKTHLNGWVQAIACSLILVLASCGGGDLAADTSSGNVGSAFTPLAHDRDETDESSPLGAIYESEAVVEPDAQLTAQALAEAEAQALEADASQPLESLPLGSIASKEAYVSGAIAHKAAAVGAPVYRFYNASTTAHFYTSDTTEADGLVANSSSSFRLEGPAFWIARAPSSGFSPVHRFYNTRTGVHFYTISEAERAQLQATQSQFSYEGVAYYASQVAGAGLIPLYRFYVPSKGFHFYTTSESEKANVQANLSATYRYEGIGYYVLNSSTQPPPTPAPSGDLAPALTVESVDAQGVRRAVQVVNGQTTVSGVAPFLVKLDASATRAPAAFRAQAAISDPEAYAFLMVGYRVNYGENRGGTWPYPQGSTFSRDEDTGPPIFSYVYRNPGSYSVRMRTRDTLGNEATIQFNIVVSSPPAPTVIRPSDGRWPTFASGRRYALEANGNYRSFGVLETGGLHNIVFEKIGNGADPAISTFSPDGRSKFSATRQTEFRAAHIRLVNIDIANISEGQRGFDYVGVIGGIVRQYTYGGQSFLWHEGSNILRSNVRYARGFFLQDTEVRSTRAGSGYVIFGNFHGFHAKNTRFVHAENGTTTWAMLRIYGSHFSLRNNLWHMSVDGGSSNGTVTSLLALDGRLETRWRDDDTVGPINGANNSDRYGYISEKQIVQNNQIYSEGSFVANGIASVGGGNPSGAQLVRPRLIGWEDNVFFQSGNVARLIQSGEVYGQHVFWRNNRRALGRGSYVSATSGAPNRNVGDNVTYNGPHLIENENSRPLPRAF